jgi:hypothetical protein
MSCAYRTHRYRASVTAHPVSVSWGPTTGHAQHPIPLRLPVVHPERQVVTETSTSTDNTSIPVSLIQYLWLQWHTLPSREQDTVAAILGELMRSPRWHWDVTVLRDHSPPDPQDPFVTERAGRPTIGMPITMLRKLWIWVLGNIDERASILRWWTPIIDPALWQELPEPTEQAWYRLCGYLSPVLLPDIAHTTHHLLSSADPDDHQMALTMLDQWMASDDHATRDLAAQMLRAWLNEQAAASPMNDQLRLRAITILASSDDPTVVSTHLDNLLRTAWNRIKPADVRTGITLLHGRGDGRSFATVRWMSLLGEMVRNLPSEEVICEVLDQLMPTIVPPDRPDDRVAWAATLWTLLTDSTLSGKRRLAFATALTPMMQEPMVAALVHAQLCTDPSLLQTIPAPICDTLLTGLIHTAHADAVLRMIAQEIRQNPDAIARFDRILAAGWGHGHDHRIIQIITAHPSPHWRTVLTQGITASVGAEVCAFIQSQAQGSPDQALAMIVDHIHARERRGDWPLAPLPAHLIPWVGAAARRRPGHLHPTTIRRLWLANPKQAWNVTQTMLHSGHLFVQQCAIDAMDTGWGTGYDAEVATTLRERILKRHWDGIETGISTVVAGIGTAPPSIMEPLLTELAARGNTDVQKWLIQHMHRGWGRGQDALMMRIVEMIAERDSSESDWVWSDARATLIRAWDHLPPHVVVSLFDRVVTRGIRRRYYPIGDAITACAPGWTHLPTAHMIARIAHHVAHLHTHAHTLAPYERDTLVAAWASVIAAGADRLSATDIHALLDPLWALSPHGCLTGIAQGVRR